MIINWSLDERVHNTRSNNDRLDNCARADGIDRNKDSTLLKTDEFAENMRHEKMTHNTLISGL